MSNHKQVKIGVVGCTGRGRHHLERLAALEDVPVVAIAAASQQARTRVGDQVQLCQSFRENRRSTRWRRRRTGDTCASACCDGGSESRAWYRHTHEETTGTWHW